MKNEAQMYVSGIWLKLVGVRYHFALNHDVEAFSNLRCNSFTLSTHKEHPMLDYINNIKSWNFA